MTDRLMYEREHRMNSKLISDNGLLRAVHQDDRNRIHDLEVALRSYRAALAQIAEDESLSRGEMLAIASDALGSTPSGGVNG